MAKNIIIKPVVSEKADRLVNKMNRYTFYVNPDANKIEVKKEIEKMFGVEVKSVNTVRMVRKARSRFTKGGFVSGTTKLKKKAIITLAEGEVIDFYEDI